MPTRQNFLDSMPLMWPAELQVLLPARSASLLANQKLKFSKDWAAVHAAFPSVDYDDYLYRKELSPLLTFSTSICFMHCETLDAEDKTC